MDTPHIRACVESAGRICTHMPRLRHHVRRTVRAFAGGTPTCPPRLRHQVRRALRASAGGTRCADQLWGTEMLHITSIHKYDHSRDDPCELKADAMVGNDMPHLRLTLGMLVI